MPTDVCRLEMCESTEFVQIDWFSIEDLRVDGSMSVDNGYDLSLTEVFLIDCGSIGVLLFDNHMLSDSVHDQPLTKLVLVGCCSPIEVFRIDDHVSFDHNR